MSLPGRPSSPPSVLTSSSQILKASSPVLPTTANGPVNSMLKPILIGSTARAAGALLPARSPLASNRYRNPFFPPPPLGDAAAGVPGLAATPLQRLAFRPRPANISHPPLRPQ